MLPKTLNATQDGLPVRIRKEYKWYSQEFKLEAVRLAALGKQPKSDFHALGRTLHHASDAQIDPLRPVAIALRTDRSSG